MSEDGINCMSWSENETLVVGGMSHLIEILDVNEKRVKSSLNCRDSVVMSLDSINENCILSGHEDGFIRLWD